MEIQTIKKKYENILSQRRIVYSQFVCYFALVKNENIATTNDKQTCEEKKRTTIEFRWQQLFEKLNITLQACAICISQQALIGRT